MRAVLLLCPLLAACTTPRSDAPAAATQPLVCAPPFHGAEPEALESRGPLSLGRAWLERDGNHHPRARFVLRAPAVAGATLDLGEGLAAALLAEGALVVRPDETLERFDARGCGKVIARDVLPDLAVSPDGDRFAYVLRKGDGVGIEVGSAAGARALASAFAEADRPLFLDARRLLFVGSPTPGVSSFHVTPIDGPPEDLVPRRLDVGAIPASREGYRVDGAVVRFHDGQRLRALDVAAGVLR